MLFFNGYCYSRIWSWYEEPCLERKLVVCPGEKATLLSTNHTFIRIYSKVLKGFCQNNLWEVDLNWKINRHECCFLLFPRFLAPWNIYWILNNTGQNRNYFVRYAFTFHFAVISLLKPFDSFPFSWTTYWRWIWMLLVHFSVNNNNNNICFNKFWSNKTWVPTKFL